jgi:hypothetical protein
MENRLIQRRRLKVMTPNYEQVLTQVLALPASERLRLISEIAQRLARGEMSAEPIGDRDQAEHQAWWAAFMTEIEAMPSSLPADLSTNPKYMEGFGQDGQTL